MNEYTSTRYYYQDVVRKVQRLLLGHSTSDACMQVVGTLAHPVPTTDRHVRRYARMCYGGAISRAGWPRTAHQMDDVVVVVVVGYRRVYYHLVTKQ